MWSQFILNAKLLVGTMICIGFPCWAGRRKYELDEVLSPRARTARWVVIAITFLIVTFPVGQITNPWIGYARVIVAFVCVAFFCWPNLINRVLNKQSELDIQ
jgi:hypothetical protein